MNNIQEACAKIKEYLDVWYKSNKQVDGHGLYEAKKQFIEENPEYQQFDDDILVALKGDPSNWDNRCSCWECVLGHPIVIKGKGVLVEPINWEETRRLAFMPTPQVQVTTNALARIMDEAKKYNARKEAGFNYSFAN